MAADASALPVNGNYATSGYDVQDSTYVPSNTAEYTGQDLSTAGGNSAEAGNADIPKDEVAWFFVEKYYTTLSKSPEKLFLFYNKSSQYVSGTETEKVQVCVGQKAINDRIKELDIQDCKVRVTNVDSQASRSNIVIQVIGEISNKSAPQQKFTQTFVLAEQANGYFVLNDIFRYLLDDEEEFTPEEEQAEQLQVEAATGHQEPPAVAVADSAPQTLTSSENVEEQVHDAALVDQGIEQAVDTEGIPTEVPTMNGDDVPITVEEVQEEEAPVVAAVAAVEPPTAEASEVIEKADVEEEKPKDPAPSPVPAAAATLPSTAATASAVPVVAAKPPATKTWANLVAGNRASAAVTPAVPTTTTTTTTTPSAVSSTAAAKSIQPVQPQAPTTPTAPAASTPPAQDSDQVDTPHSSESEWQTAGQEHSRKQSRPQGTQTPAENSRAYIKNVNENIDNQALQAALSKISEISYLDINRQKNCAFVDFATPAGYRAAVAANPHEVSGERLYVEERRVRPPGSYPGGYGPRGGGQARGNPRPSSQGRGGFPKDGARGGYNGRGRGGNVGSRGGRGGSVSQAA